MAVHYDELLAELKKLRKGRGVQGLHVLTHVGPALRAVCGIADGDSPPAARHRLVERLSAWAGALPADLSVVVLVALGLHRQVQGKFLQERVEWLAGQQERDVRTIRRRVDEGLQLLAEVAMRSVSPARTNPAEWYLERFEAILRLDLPEPTCFERRRIVVDCDRLDHVILNYTLPPCDDSSATQWRILVEAQYGAKLMRVEHVSETRFRMFFQLPMPLSRGCVHDFGIVVRLPKGQPMRPHYIFLPERRCDYFELRVRFAPPPPQQVERVSEVFHREVDEAPAGADPIAVDRFGETCVRFQDLVPRLGYGLRWELAKHTTESRQMPSWHSSGFTIPAIALLGGKQLQNHGHNYHVGFHRSPPR